MPQELKHIDATHQTMTAGWKHSFALIERGCTAEQAQRAAGLPLRLKRFAMEVLYSVEAASMDATEAPLGVEGGSSTPLPVSDPAADPLESILPRP